MFKKLFNKINNLSQEEKHLFIIIVSLLLFLLFAFWLIRKDLHNPLQPKKAEAGGIDIEARYRAFPFASISADPPVDPIGLSIAENALKDAITTNEGYKTPITALYGKDSQPAIDLMNKMIYNSKINGPEYLKLRNRKNYNQIIRALNKKIEALK